MTLIAFHAQADCAEIITDTLSYTVTQRRLARMSKVLLLPHLDAAVITHGSAQFSRYWEQDAMTPNTADFDAFTTQVPGRLREIWAEIKVMDEHRNAIHGGTRNAPRSVAFVVGYSPAQRRFRALSFSSQEDFTPAELDGLWVIPSPLDSRPSELEFQRLQETVTEQLGDASHLDVLKSLPRPQPPTTVDGWVHLAKAAREHRSLAPIDSGLKMYVGGDVIYTRLEVGCTVQRRVHTFDDHGAEFAEMMAGSLHPVGQLGTCTYCDSGQPLVDCCLRELNEQPCPCGSGTTFASCCRVPGAVGSSAAETAVLSAGRP